MATPQEDYTPRYQGDTDRPLQHTFTDHLGATISLTGAVAATMTLRMHNQGTGAVTMGTGTWTITDAANGLAFYAWSAADVAVAGIYLIQAGVIFPDGPLHFDARVLEIKPLA